MKKLIPIAHCFNNNYSIPAGVAFHSMLMNANSEFQYKIYVLHSDITIDNQIKLAETVGKFENASIEFIDMKHKFEDLFKKTKEKAHYSKEMYYKFLMPSIFFQYEKIMLADVDVVYLGDISRDFLNFNCTDDYYLAGAKSPILKNSWQENYYQTIYEKDFTVDEIQKLRVGAGYFVYNLNLMRADRIEEKLIAFAQNNLPRLKQPEQDVINLICHPKIKVLPLNTMICSYLYDLFKTDVDLNNALNHSYEEVKFALDNPIQLHFATGLKPWNNPDGVKSEIWFEFLSKTVFLKDYLKKWGEIISQLNKEKILFQVKIPFSKRKIILKKSKC